MGDEAVEGSKMGTKLIMFVAIVALALVAFLVGKNLVNTGVDSMESAVANINDSRFSDYDRKTVRGRAVKSAIETFRNEGVAIVVCTLEMAEAGDIDDVANPSQTCAVTINGSTMQVNDGTVRNDVIGVNYNALLGERDGAAEIQMTNGQCNFNDNFEIDPASNNIVFYLDTLNLNRKGTVEYIADASSFTANLIQNDAGEVIGIVFLQRRLI